MKPKNHKNTLEKGICELKEIKKINIKIPKKFIISKIQENNCYLLWNKYKKECNRLHNYKTLRLYHLTETSNVKSICKNGFDISLSRMRAFGKGINLANTISHLKHYYNMYKNKNNNVSIIVCEVCVKKSHENESDITADKFIEKYGYSKPKYMSPKKGYDSMYAGPIWIIPSSSRVYPSFVIEGKFI